MSMSIEREKRILLVEDEKDCYEPTLRLLEEEGYKVKHAQDLKEAAFELQTNHYHVVIIDMYLSKSERYSDEPQGAKLLEAIRASSLNRVITRIILTNHDDKEVFEKSLMHWKVHTVLAKAGKTRHDGYMVTLPQVLAGAFKELNDDRDGDRLYHCPKLTLEFLYESDKKVIPAVVDHIIQEEGTKLASDGVLSKFSPEGATQGASQECLILEAYDLLSHLLIDYDKVHIIQMSGGLTGAGVIRALPQGHQGVGREYVVKMGRRDKLTREYLNYKKWVEPRFAGGAVTAASFSESHHLGAILYNFAENEAGERLQEFDRLFLDPSKPAVAISQGLSLLFKRTFRMLHGEKRATVLSLPEDYYESLELQEKGKINRILIELTDPERVKQNFPSGILSFDLQSPSFSCSMFAERLINPFTWLQKNEQNCVQNAFRCVTHGDLTGRNMMSDSRVKMEGSPSVASFFKLWLIDFYRTGESHILRDHVILETDIKYRLCKDLTLAQFVRLEKWLLKIESVTEDAHDTPVLMKRAYEVIAGLHESAREVRNNANTLDDEQEYFIALLMVTVNIIRLKHIAPMQKLFALVSASLICSWIEYHKNGHPQIPSLELKQQDLQGPVMYKHDIAISYSSKDAAIVEPIAECLRRNGKKVFTYTTEEAQISAWGENLVKHLAGVFSKEAQVCLVFISKGYVQSPWTQLELEFAQARALEDNKVYILPIRLDHSEVPGMSPTRMYLDGNEKSAEQICDFTIKKLELLGS